MVFIIKHSNANNGLDNNILTLFLETMNLNLHHMYFALINILIVSIIFLINLQKLTQE